MAIPDGNTDPLDTQLQIPGVATQLHNLCRRGVSPGRSAVDPHRAQRGFILFGTMTLSSQSKACSMRQQVFGEDSMYAT